MIFVVICIVLLGLNQYLNLVNAVWNIKFKKGSISLCTIYPRENYFTILIVICKKEKESFMKMFSSFSSGIQ